jgi:hypothetical protein
MKISIVLTLLIIVFLIVNIAAINYDQISNKMIDCIDSAFSNSTTNPHLSAAYIDKAILVYEKYEFFLAATLHHQEIHNMQDLMFDAKGYIKNNEIGHFQAELYKMKFYMEKMKEVEKISLINIF